MIDIALTVEGEQRFRSYMDFAKMMPDNLIPLVSQTLQTEIEPALLTDFQVEPGAVKLPIEWTSERQRRFVKAKQRRGEIPFPYVRTHGVSKGWKTEQTRPLPDQLVFILHNTSPAMQFVEGRYQQRFHKNTGWLDALPLAELWGGRVFNNMRSTIITIFKGTRPRG